MTNKTIQSYYRHTRFDYRTFWHKQAVHFGFYDEHARHHAAALENMNRVMADLAEIRAGETILDAGCGWGSACFWLARNKRVLATGISLVRDQVEGCRRYAVKNQMQGVRFLEADYRQTPFADGSFDVIWACESICHAEQKGAFYQEAYRLLKPDGRLVLAEYIRAARPCNAKGEALLAAWLHPWAIRDLDTAAEHRTLALAAGFTTFNLDDVTPNVRVSLRNLHDLTRKWLPLGRVFNRVKLINDVRLHNAEASVAQYEALQTGAWWYGLGLARKEKY